MDKNNKRNTEKQSQPKVKKQENKFKFSFNKNDIKCFISAKEQTMSKQIVNSTEKMVDKIQICKVSKQQNKSDRNRSLSKIDSSHRIFNNKLLVMHYDQDEMYIDSARANNSNTYNELKQDIHEADEAENDIVTSCIKVITEETDNSSNNPLSARYTPQNPAEIYQFYDFGYYLDQNIRARNRRSVSQEQSTMFQIDLSNIEKDGRTTLMLRNIPNKYTRDMILDQIDSLNFKKKYDFFYLPIDYRNQCNVGYAFINFIHTKFINEFYEEFHEKKWQKFNSEKICQVCYARIQGTAQLVSHFKNSNVIQQKDKKLRPLIEVDYSNLAEMVQRQKNESTKQISA